MGQVKGTSKDVPEVDKSTPKKEADSIVARAKAQANKIVQDAQVRAKRIIQDALEEAGQQASEVERGPEQAWYYNKAGESEIFEVGKQPKGWYDSPEAAAKSKSK